MVCLYKEADMGVLFLHVCWILFRWRGVISLFEELFFCVFFGGGGVRVWWAK